MKFTLVEDLKEAGYSQRRALKISNVSRGTYHYHHHPRPRVNTPIPQSERNYPSRLDIAECEAIITQIRESWARGESVLNAFASTWDDGIYLGSLRQWYRVANTIDQDQRPRSPLRRHRPKRAAPVVVADGPGQVWMWDITDLKATYMGQAFKAYVIQDLYSRNIIGHCVALNENDDIAAAMFAEAIDRHGAPRVIHSDNGAPMRSTALAELCEEMDIELSFNRPRTSNDNPFKESEFRTMKYRPGYPGVFDTLEAARDWIDYYVVWFNTRHHHSGIALHTPQSVYNGTWTQAHDRRVGAINTYHRDHPERFHQPPTVKRPQQRVAINLHHQPTA